jgi:hypothetical protein
VSYSYVQVVFDSGKRIEKTIGAPRRAAEQFSTGFNIANALFQQHAVGTLCPGLFLLQVVFDSGKRIEQTLAHLGAPRSSSAPA